MALLHTLVLAAASLALVPQDDPSTPPADPAPADPAPAPADPAPAGDTPGGSDLKSMYLSGERSSPEFTRKTMMSGFWVRTSAMILS